MAVPLPHRQEVVSQELRDRLARWREEWMQWREELSNTIFSRDQIWMQLDKALDDLGDALGQGRRWS